MNLDFLDCGRTTYDTIHLMYACIMRHTHEPHEPVLRHLNLVLLLVISQEGNTNNRLTFYGGGEGRGERGWKRGYFFYR